MLLLGTASACYSVASPIGWADPVFDGNAVYYTPTHGKLEAYDLSAKKVLWDFPSSAQTKQVKPEAFYGTPVLDQQTLYSPAYNGTIYALNRDNGQIRWSFNTGAPLVGGALLKDGVLYAGNSIGRVVALQASDGKQLWQQVAGRQVWSTPVDAGGLIVVTSMNNEVYAFNLQGQPAWKSTAANAAIASTPTSDASHLTFGAFDKRYHAINSADGSAVWASTTTAQNWFWTVGLLSGDNLYAGNLDGHLYVFDPSDGALKWQVDLGSPIRSAPALAAGTLVVAGRDGMIHGLDPASGQDKWSPVDAGGSVLSNLVASKDEMVYAATQPGSKNSARLLQIDPAKGSASVINSP